MDILDLRNAIDAKLQTLVGAGQPLKSALNYHTLDNEGFPYATFEPSVIEGQYLDTCNNTREYTFDLILYQEIEGDDRSDALETLLKAHREITNAFDKDYTLGGVALGGVEAISGEFGQLVSSNGKTLVANIKIICKIIVDIT